MKDPTVIKVEELNQHDYRFVVRRNSPKPTGFLGTFYGEDLRVCDGFIEEAVRNFFGGGRYSVKVYKDSIPQPGVIRVHIAGTPKKSKKESEIKKQKQEIKKLESQVEKHPILKAIQVFSESFSDALDESLNKQELSDEKAEVAEASANNESLLKDILQEIQEIKTGNQQELEIKEIKELIIQSQAENTNLHQMETYQIRQAFSLMKRQMQYERGEFIKVIKELKNKQELNFLVSLATLYFSPKVKKFVDENIKKIINQF